MARSTIGRARLVLFPRSKTGEFRVMLRPENGFARTVPLAECSSLRVITGCPLLCTRAYADSSLLRADCVASTVENVRTVRNKNLFGIKGGGNERECICKREGFEEQYSKKRINRIPCTRSFRSTNTDSTVERIMVILSNL